MPLTSLAPLADSALAGLAPGTLAAGEFEPYLAWWKAVPFLLIFLLWCKALAWADKDAVVAHLPREALNAGMLAGLIVAVAAFFLTPNFLLATFVFLVLFAAEVGTYLLLRNNAVGLGDLKKDASAAYANLGKKKDKKEGDVAAGVVQLFDKNGRTVQPPPPESDDFAPYDAVQLMLDEPLSKRAERVDVVSRNGQAQVTYNVDGVGYEGRTMAGDTASAGIRYLKNLAGLDVEDKRRPQSGKVKVNRLSDKHELQLRTAGSTSGESLSVEVDPANRYKKTLDDLGLTNDQSAALEASMSDPGVVILAAPEDMGLTTLAYAILRKHDAFLQHLQTVERKPAADLEGITQNKLETRDAAEAAKKLDWITSQEPDAVAVTDAVDAAVVKSGVSYVAKAGKKLYLCVRAANTFDALAAYRRLSGDDDKSAMKHVKLVIAGRVMRRLCEATKVPYDPDDKTLKLLGRKPGSVEHLYKPHFGPLLDAQGREVPDEFCGGLGYKGRLGAYEVLMVDDDVRQAARSGSSGALRTAFRKQGGKYLQEAALARVIAGETSLQEVLRVMKSGDKGDKGEKPERADAPDDAPAARKPSRSAK